LPIILSQTVEMIDSQAGSSDFIRKHDDTWYWIFTNIHIEV